MKTKTHLYLLTLLLLAIVACKKETIEHENSFDRSYKSWISFKAAANDTYRYHIVSSSWTGNSSETIITVKNGKVINRSYLAKAVVQPGNTITVISEWTEDEKSLNTHNDGATTLTLDEIYDRAKSVWLVKRKDAKTSLETNNNGMISSCGYIINGCQDDCFNGISISVIEKM